MMEYTSSSQNTAHGSFIVNIPEDLLPSDLPSSDDEWVFSLDYEDLELLANATSNDIQASSTVTSIPDLAESALNLPPPETPSAPKRFKKSTEDEIQNLYDARQSDSTKRNTAWGIKLFQDWNKECIGQPMDMKNVSVTALADALKRFYCEARPQGNGSDTNGIYHKNTLINIRAAINRHLADLQRNIDIVRDKQFKIANGVLDGLLKERTRTGVSRPTKHKEIINEHDLQKICTYLKGASSNPIILRQSVWYSLSIQFISRGMEFHHQLKKNSIMFHEDDTGEYVTLTYETQQKNYQGGLKSKESPTDKRMYATGLENCPVQMLKLLMSKTPESATYLFNHYNNEAVLSPSTTTTWYTDKPLCKRTFARFMSTICKSAGVENKYTPHCLRATAIQYLNDQGYEARHIMFMSSHQNETSLRSYNRSVSDRQKKALSASLSAITHDENYSVTRAISTTNQQNPSMLSNSNFSVVPFNNNQTLSSTNILSTPGLFTGSSFTTCTFNFGCGSN